MPDEPTPTPATPAAAVVAAVHAAAVPPPAAPAVQTPAAGITLTPEQWAAYATTQTRIAELETAERGRASAAADAEIKALQAKGQIDQAFAVQRQHAETLLEAERKKYRDTEDRAKRYALDGELGRALSAHQLTVGAAAHLTKLLRDEFTVEAQGDSFAVRSKDFRSVGDFITATLATPEYSSFVRALNPGGGTAGGTAVQSAQTAPANPAAAVQPRNLGEQLAAAMIARGNTAPDARIAGAGALNPDGSFGPQAAPAFGLRPMARQA